ncbi:hypothetical protein SAMN05421687_10819 [Salimicrobium flavidum]|uniref:Cxxc_20_cxxc protein n=1 Tax=Salimicrobium flavidum TaxID=570947 RepID=A0A1N7JXB9_9BACI|nr:hypothetical protein SAMN05421687_10819 [Salimicrobium flavidum]
MRCPNCHSENIVKTPIRTFIFLVVVSLFSFVTLAGIFFLPLLILGIPGVILSFLIFLLPLPRFKCVECNKAYTKKKVTA